MEKNRSILLCACDGKTLDGGKAPKHDRCYHSDLPFILFQMHTMAKQKEFQRPV